MERQSVLCDTCYASVYDDLIERHLEWHRRETEAKAEVAATLGMLVEIVCPSAQTLMAEHGILATPASTKVEFAASCFAALAKGGEPIAVEEHAGSEG